MKSHTKNLRFNHNPLNLILGTRKKQGLRIGYMGLHWMASILTVWKPEYTRKN